MLNLRSCLPLLLVSSLTSAAAIHASENQQIIKNKDIFEFTYQVTIPEIECKKGRLWLPIASSDRHQKVDLLGVTTQSPWRLIKDEQFGNRILTMSLGKRDAGKKIELRYRVERREINPLPDKISNEPFRPFVGQQAIHFKLHGVVSNRRLAANSSHQLCIGWAVPQKVGKPRRKAATTFCLVSYKMAWKQAAT